jgi:hypothetical protein
MHAAHEAETENGKFHANDDVSRSLTQGDTDHRNFRLDSISIALLHSKGKYRGK